jgi:peptidoglycan/LPS O-acetylase OafA/YrhL
VSSRPPDAVAPPPGNPRFPLLDPLRAVAALFIVLTHTAGLGGFNDRHFLGAWTARLDCGVAVFFVLSGFLLYRPFVAARLEGRRRPGVWRYARRRALRILPAYWVALTLQALIWPQYVKGVFGDHWWSYYGLFQSWSASTIVAGMGVAWSLSVEAAFYVLLPVYALAMARAVARRPPEAQARFELVALALSALAAVAARIAVQVWQPGTVYANTLPGNWLWFTLGLGLAVTSARPSRPRYARFAVEHPAACWAGAFACLTVAAWAVGLPRRLGSPYSTFSLEAQHLLYAGVAICLVAPMALHDGRRSAPAALMSTRVLAWLGLVSYGIFLWHQPLVIEFLPVMNWIVFPGWVLYTVTVAAAATAVAALSYYLVERPLLRLKEPRRATGGARARARSRAVAAKSES